MLQSRRLTVLHVATINKPITPQLGYGPIETVIYNIDKGLHQLGHRSIVACSSDSAVVGEHCETIPYSLGDYLRDGAENAQMQVGLHLSRALARAQRGDIDVVHMHQWLEHVYAGSFNPSVPVVMTLHVPAPNSGLAEFNETHVDRASRPLLHFVAISDYQRREYAPIIPVAKTVPHGIDVAEYMIGDAHDRGEYLLSIGRITEDKGPDVAIAVARQSGARLVVAGCVQNKREDRAFFESLKSSIDLAVDVGRCPVNGDYYDEVMRPVLSSEKQIIYIGELGAAAKKHWYRHARATLFPIRWGEPFGLVLIESMASGTPVVAFGKGAVPEIVRDGETGFVVDSIEAMVKAVGCLERIDRRACRRHVANHFSVRRMAEGYAAIYDQLANVPAASHRRGRTVTDMTPKPVPQADLVF